MKNIILERAYTDSATIGKMYMPSGTVFDTIELPWRGNQASVSCIPEGRYVLKKRQSSVVERTSKGKYQAGWEVANVEGRTYIMIHIGNKPSDFQGCIGIGQGLGVVNNEWAILRSSTSFESFMKEMETDPNWELVIRVRTVEFP
jgi:pantothenate kinase